MNFSGFDNIFVEKKGSKSFHWHGRVSGGARICLKRPSIVKLDSLLQEVCIKAVLFSYNPSLFRTNESPLIPKYVLLIPNTLLQYGPCNVGN